MALGLPKNRTVPPRTSSTKARRQEGAWYIHRTTQSTEKHQRVNMKDLVSYAIEFRLYPVCNCEPLKVLGKTKT